MTKNRLEFDRKNSHRQTLILEHDQKFTPRNINFGHTHMLMLSQFYQICALFHLHLEGGTSQQQFKS